MELTELRSFIVLTEMLHFGRTAQRLHITQPALTKQIKRLEMDLGGNLFQRGNGGVSLTRAGEVLKEKAARILNDIGQAEQLTRLAVEGNAGVLRIGFGITTLPAGLASLLRQYRQMYPNVLLQLEDMSTPSQISALEEIRIDIGFVRLPVINKSLITTKAFEERLVIAIPQDMKIIQKQGLSAFAKEPFVGLSRSVSSSYSNHVTQTCLAAGFTPIIVQEAKEFHTILHCVGASMGVAIVPLSLKHMRIPNVKFVETQVKEAHWHIGLTWRRRDKGQALIENFIKLVRK